jgi:D-threo-aldose 1-dehydrogenase
VSQPSGEFRPNLRPLGSTGLVVSSVCIGTSPFANIPGLYGYEVESDIAVATVRAVLDSSFTFLDTSNGYGADGVSERRIGDAIQAQGGLPKGFVLATKIDPDPITGDFSGARARASFDESLERLGIDHIELLYLHDPERMTFEEATGRGGAIQAMLSLQDEGLVDHLGVAGFDIELAMRYLDTGSFEVVLNHNRYTLVDQSALPLIHYAASHDVAFVNAAPYGGGMLVKCPAAQPRYAYGVRGNEIADSVLRMQEACIRHGVPLAAAALQFSTGAPLVASTVVGISSPERIKQTVDLLEVAIPVDLWSELDSLKPASPF